MTCRMPHASQLESAAAAAAAVVDSVKNANAEYIERRRSNNGIVINASCLPLIGKSASKPSSRTDSDRYFCSTSSLLLILLIFRVLSTSASTLSGENVCQREEKYFLNVTQFVPRNITIRSFHWCMQVPPRCSTFTYRIVNESRTIEEEHYRLVDVCCDGYEPDAAGTMCQPTCSVKCLNGKCNQENKCYCEPGYRGDYCEKACDNARWGRYCRYHCECHQGQCDSALGHCHCPPGYFGIKCEKPCPQGYYGMQCREKCNCTEEQICHPQSGQCSQRVKLAVLKKYHTFDHAPQPKPTLIYKKVDMYLLTTEPVHVLQSSSETSTETLITNASVGDNNEKSTISSHNSTARENANSVLRSSDGIKTVDQTVMKSETPMERQQQQQDQRPTERKVHAEVVANDTHDNTPNGDGNKSAQISMENDDFGYDNRPSGDDGFRSQNSNYKFTIILFLSAIFVLISAFAIAIFRKQYSRQKPDSTLQDQRDKVISRSIFHTPLPEPPQSPFFESPLCAHYHTKIGENEVTIHPRQSLKIEENKDQIDAFYDQLPTGTYKATLAPEPLLNGNLYVTDFNLHSNLAVTAIEKQSEIESENVYDEIPCWTRSTENDALYINTRVENKTKF